MKKSLLIINLLIVIGLNSQNYTKNTAGQPTGSSQEVGITSGQLSVSLTGGATYQIPFAVPPGINGIVPQLSLAYNSQGRNGIAGYGWNLSGISAITRIPTTKFHDGFIDGVDFDSNDRFALDGQRLILKSGVYGGNGAVYETENYSNIKVISYGNNASPNHFKVFYPDGTVAHYGSTSNSRNNISWSIQKWINPQDIRMTYIYNNVGTSLYISKINYGRKASDAALNTVEFIYKTRNRPEHAFTSGIYQFTNTKILSEVKVIGSNANFRTYKLEHNITSLGYERLTKVTEKSSSKSHNPILFTYNDTNNNDLFQPTTTNIGLTNINALNTSYISGDFNGDAKMDVIVYPITGSKSKREYRLFTDIANGGSNSAKIHKTGKFEDIFTVSSLNHNNKLLTQQGWMVIQKTSSSYKFKVSRIDSPNSGGGREVFYEKSWGETFTSEHSCFSEPSTYVKPQKFISGDFNGDGLTDVLAISKPYSYSICRKVSEPCNGNPQFQNNNTQKVDSSLRPPDEDCCECTTYNNKSSKVTFIDLNRNKVSNFSSVAGNLNDYLPDSKENYDIQVGDFNGDGKSDFFIILENKMTVYSLDENNRLIIIAEIISDTDIDINKPHLLGDFNGDGKMDVVIPTTIDQDRWAFYFSKGSSFQKKIGAIGVYYVLPKLFAARGRQDFYYIPNDINGDGKTDIIYINNHISRTSFTNFKVLENITVNPTTISFNKISDAIPNNGDIGIGKTPLPVFLNQNNLNQNLEVALLSGSKIHHFKHTKDHRQDVLLRQVTTGNGVVETINYHPLIANDNDTYIQVYRPTYNETYPFVDLNTIPAIQVVSKLERESNNQYSKQVFSYRGAVSNVEGLGFLGFKTVLRSNWFHDGVGPIMSVSKHDMTKRGAVFESYTVKGYLNAFENTPSNFLSKTVNNYTVVLSPKKVFKLTNTSSTSYNGLQNTSVSSSMTYDTYNNPIENTTIIKAGGATQQTQTTNLDYQHNPDGGSSLTNPYYIGLVKQKNVETSASGDTYTTEERLRYSNSLLLTQKKQKGNNTPFITEDYVYDAFGNITKKTVTAGGNSRVNSYEYDTTGRFLTKETDVEGLSTEYVYDANGYLLKVTNPYDLTTKYIYDSWGKKTSEIDYLGNQTVISYSRSGFSTSITITNPDGSKGYKKFDDLGREIINGSYGLNDKWTYIKTDYDIYNRKISISEPYFGSPSQYNTSTYDGYGRLTQTKNAAGKTTDISYNELTTTVTDGYKTINTTKNALGQVVSLTDNGGTINYSYFAHGGLKRSAFDTAITTMQYDGWGRKTKLTDPSAGVYQYEYNAFGETTKEITPKGETTFVLDNNGKLTQKIVQGDDTNLESTYTYDATTKLLQRITANSGASYVYTYDNFKRLNKTVETNAYAVFERSTTFDNLGRTNTERYKTQNSSNNKTSDVTIRNEYKNGSLYRIVNNADQNELWKINTINERGQITNAGLGNGISEQSEYDAYGLPKRILSEKDDTTLIDLNFDFNAQRGVLNSRSSNLYNHNETFQYDNLNRLTKYTGTNGQQKYQNYDGKGRITSNDIGSFKYANTSKPYQNTAIGLSGATSLYYDGKDVQNISYNAFKAPVHISVNTSTTTREEINFEYNIFQQRSVEQFKKFETQETHYKTKLFSADGATEITKNLTNNTTDFITYIGGDAYSAPIVYKTNGSSTEFLYLHRDYLGSIIAISNTQGTLIEKRHFDAWGQIAMIEDQNGNALGHLTVLDRGYTGHEHLQSVDLINMNARLYDANLHRFLAPDNFVQDPYNTQNYNRYGYVLNNPLSYVDPSGDASLAQVLKLVFDVVALVVAAIVVYAILYSGAWVAVAAFKVVGFFGAVALGGAVIVGGFYLADIVFEEYSDWVNNVLNGINDSNSSSGINGISNPSSPFIFNSKNSNINKSFFIKKTSLIESLALKNFH